MVLPSYGESNAFQIRSKINSFRLLSCGKKNCLQIRATTAYTGLFSSNYAFDSAEITMTEIKSGQKTTLSAKDTYYDSEAKKVFIHGLNGHAEDEAIYDLGQERLTRFKAFHQDI
jgi:hypothetical protein